MSRLFYLTVRYLNIGNMLYMNIIPMIVFIPLCLSDTPYLLRSFPTASAVEKTSFETGPCIDPINKFTFLQGADNASLEHSECVHDSGESMLTCKLSTKNASATLDLDSYPLTDIRVLVLFVQEFPSGGYKTRVLDLCFLQRFGSALEELAICGYTPPVMETIQRSDLHILDVPALAIFASKVHTLLISGM